MNVDGHLRIRVHAADDFGLRHVALKAERDGHSLDLPLLFDRPRAAGKGIGTAVRRRIRFSPAELQLKKGDEIKYWAEAEDNKEPQHNRAETPRRTIRIVDDQDAKHGQAEPRAAGDNGTDQAGDSQPQQGKSGHGKSEAGSSGNGGKSIGRGREHPLGRTMVAKVTRASRRSQSRAIRPIRTNPIRTAAKKKRPRPAEGRCEGRVGAISNRAIRARSRSILRPKLPMLPRKS